MVKNPSAMLETQVRSLGCKVPLEKGMATHSNILAWRIPWKEEPGGLQSMGSQRVGHSRAANDVAFAQEPTVAQIHCSASSNVSVRQSAVCRNGMSKHTV